VRLIVPEEGGVALAYTSNKRTSGAAYDDLGPSDLPLDPSDVRPDLPERRGRGAPGAGGG
jgi:hypothetical protein